MTTELESLIASTLALTANGRASRLNCELASSGSLMVGVGMTAYSSLPNERAGQGGAPRI